MTADLSDLLIAVNSSLSYSNVLLKAANGR